MKNFDNTEEKGIDATKAILIDFGWIFREITKRDIGLDAFVETPDGYFIFLQIKTGASHFYRTESCLTFYFGKKHFKYWSNLRAPVFIIGHIPEEEKTYYVKFDTKIVHRTKSRFKIEIPLANILSSNCKNIILDSVIEIREPNISLSFDEEFNSISFTSNTIDMGKLRELGIEKDWEAYTPEEKIIEISKELEQKALKWDHIINCKKHIYGGEDPNKWRIRLIKTYIELKEFQHAKSDIYLLIQDNVGKNDLEGKLTINLCKFFIQLIERHNNGYIEVKNIKDAYYIQFILKGENLIYYPDLMFIPILCFNGSEQELSPVYNYGLINIDKSNILKPITVKIKVHYLPEIRDNKKLDIQKATIIPKQGFSLNGIIYDEYGVNLMDINE